MLSASISGVNVKAKAALLCAAVMVAPPSAFSAETAGPDAPCNQLLPSDSDLRLGQVIGSGRIGLLSDGPNCPGPAAACRSGFSAAPGATLLLGKGRPPYVCAFEARTGMMGWVADQRLAARPVDPTPPLAAWIGTWRLYDNRIVLKQAGESVEADGDAYWPGKNIMPANEGSFAGTARPSGNRLHFGGDDQQGCQVDMTLAGPFLVVADNTGCGGHNVSFTGIFTRRAR
jgi:hypothetical protein